MVPTILLSNASVLQTYAGSWKKFPGPPAPRALWTPVRQCVEYSLTKPGHPYFETERNYYIFRLLWFSITRNRDTCNTFLIAWRCHAKDISYNATYDIFAMNAVKRIVVGEEVWADLSQMREPGMTFSRLIENMIEHEKKRRLVEDIMRIQEEEDLVEIEL